MKLNVNLWVTTNAKLNALASKVRNQSFSQMQQRFEKLNKKIERLQNKQSIKRLISKKDSGKMFDDDSSTARIFPVMEWNKTTHILAREERDEPMHS